MIARILDTQGEPLPITPRAWRHSIFLLDPPDRDNRSNWPPSGPRRGSVTYSVDSETAGVGALFAVI